MPASRHRLEQRPTNRGMQQKARLPTWSLRRPKRRRTSCRPSPRRRPLPRHPGAIENQGAPGATEMQVPHPEHWCRSMRGTQPLRPQAPRWGTRLHMPPHRSQMVLSSPISGCPEMHSGLLHH